MIYLVHQRLRQKMAECEVLEGRAKKMTMGMASTAKEAKLPMMVVLK